jgi:hypothetical protein
MDDIVSDYALSSWFDFLRSKQISILDILGYLSLINSMNRPMQKYFVILYVK